MIYQVKIRHLKQMQDGAMKYVNEPYLVNATSVIAAEAAVTEQVAPYLNEYTVEEITKPRVSEVIVGAGGDFFFRCKAIIDTTDNKGNEVQSAVYLYIANDTFDGALEKAKECLKSNNYEIRLLQLSPVVDYIIDKS